MAEAFFGLSADERREVLEISRECIGTPIKAAYLPFRSLAESKEESLQFMDLSGVHMPHIHKVATLTSKGQVTLPKAVRQALGLDTGSKVAFDLLGSQVVVSRVESDVHEDPAIGSFLSLLAQDIHQGRHIGLLPADLATSMLAQLHEDVDLDADISGDVAL